MIFPAHAWFFTGKINVKLAYTYKGRTKIYFLKCGVVEQKSLRNPALVDYTRNYVIAAAFFITNGLKLHSVNVL